MSDAEDDPTGEAQNAFLLRSRAAIEHARATGSGISPEELLARMDAVLERAKRYITPDRLHRSFDVRGMGPHDVLAGVHKKKGP